MHDESGRKPVTHWWVIGVALIALLGYPVSTSASAVTPLPAVSEIIVRYELGAPPVISDGRPWGSQCVRAKDRALIKRGPWIGAGMRRIELSRTISQRRANRISTAFASCPYVMWAEPNAVVFDLQLDPPARP